MLNADAQGMGAPLVSILIPCRNAAPWVAAALKSAVNQTWCNAEVILVDDGSTDGSYEMARQFASRRCQVFRQTCAGASAARNHALAVAQGAYIQYLDADDFLAPDKIEVQLRAVEELGDGCVSLGAVIHFHDDDLPENGVWEIPDVASEGMEPWEFLCALWGGEGQVDMVQTGQWLIPRNLIEKAGPWDEQLSVDDDGEFFARVVLASDRIMAVPDSQCYYRKFRDGGSLSASGCRESAMRAAQMKCTYLLNRSTTLCARRAVRRLIGREIVLAYPQLPEIVRDGRSFLSQRGIPMSQDFEGSPWFRRLQKWIGWKAARWIQWNYREAKSVWANARAADSPQSARSREEASQCSGHRLAAANCSPHPAIARPRV